MIGPWTTCHVPLCAVYQEPLVMERVKGYYASLGEREWSRLETPNGGDSPWLRPSVG